MNASTASRQRNIIWIISVAIPLIVAGLLFSPVKFAAGSWVRYLPHLHGTINTLTAVILLLGLYFIKKEDVINHRRMMVTAFILGLIFLVSYVTYHSSADSTVFGDTNGNGILEDAERSAAGSTRGIYLILLLTHILTAVAVVPLVLMALYHALGKNFERHKKVVKFAYPVWLYVSVTGVLVYLMIRPYY